MEKAILGNNILDVVAVAWFTAQFLKVILGLITDRKFYYNRFWETGGLPSSHSATVVSLSTAMAIVHGISSSQFAISIVLAVIVIHDAVGIRRAAGKQAGVLNRMGILLNKIYNEGYNHEEMKELLGHKPVEVLAGAILGIAITFLMRGHLV